MNGMLTALAEMTAIRGTVRSTIGKRFSWKMHFTTLQTEEYLLELLQLTAHSI